MNLEIICNLCSFESGLTPKQINKESTFFSIISFVSLYVNIVKS